MKMTRRREDRTAVGWRKFDYYQWLLEKVNGYAEPYYNYSLLLNELHSIEFTWSIKRDENRAFDGEKLRWIYMDENNIPDLYYTPGVKCSVLEMLIGLSLRCDIDIMGEGDEPDASKWFWIMIDNLDLMRCTDDNFSPGYVRQQIEIWLDRVYQRNGKGSPFPLRKSHRDQRKVEIWLQMCGYLSENYI